MSSWFWWRCRAAATADSNCVPSAPIAASSSAAPSASHSRVACSICSSASSPRMLSTCWIIAARLACSAARRSSSARRSASMRCCSAMPLRARPAAAFEARHAVRFELERRFGRQRRPLAFGALQFLRGALRGRRNRFDASHQARHLLLPRFECEPPCRFAPRPVLASLPAPSLTPICSSPVPPPVSRVSRSSPASFDSTARSSAATPASL